MIKVTYQYFYSKLVVTFITFYWRILWSKKKTWKKIHPQKTFSIYLALRMIKQISCTLKTNYLYANNLSKIQIITKILKYVELELIFYLLRTFCSHLGCFLCCFFFHYVSAKFHFWPSSGDLPWPRIGMLSLVTVSPVITTFHSCCLLQIDNLLTITNSVRTRLWKTR